MRISDWSSDVCSSDLEMELDANWTDSSHDVDDMSTFGSTFADQELDITGSLPVLISHKPNTLNADWAAPNPDLVNATDEQYFADQRVQFWRAAMDHFEESRSEEHTSELQSLMRISYAVFCLKKKK